MGLVSFRDPPVRVLAAVWLLCITLSDLPLLEEMRGESCIFRSAIVVVLLNASVLFMTINFSLGTDG